MVPLDSSCAQDSDQLIGLRQYHKRVESRESHMRREGAKWADPLKVISRLHYRQDGQGYLRPGYSHVFLVSSEGGSARGPERIVGGVSKIP